MGKLSAAVLLPLLTTAFAAQASAADVQVQLLRGESLSGELTAASADKITIGSGGNEQVFPGPEVLAVEFPGAKEDVETPRVWIELLDGTKIHAAGISSVAGKATIELLGGDRLTDIPTRSIRAVRFNPPDDPQVSTAWSEILAAKRAGDVLVLRKTVTRTVEEGDQQKTVTTVALDEIEGTVLQVSDTTIKFDFDGDKVDVKRERLEGIIFVQPVKRELPAASLRLFDVSGGEWRLRTLDLKSGQLTATTPVGVTLQLPLARVKRLDYSAGNVAMLAQLPIEARESTTALLPKGLSPAALGWFEPGGKRPGRPAKGGTSSASMVSLTGKSQVTYRVPEGFRWFRAGLVLAGKQGTGSDVEVVILGDGKPLVKQQLLATAERKPMLIEVDISGVRRVTLQTLPLAGQGLGALVDFQDARFTK
jgi:hypothetical protein